MIDINQNLICNTTTISLTQDNVTIGDCFKVVLEAGSRFIIPHCENCRKIFYDTRLAKNHICLHFNPNNPKTSVRTPVHTSVIYKGIPVMLMIDLRENERESMQCYADKTGTVFAMLCPFCQITIAGCDIGWHVKSHAINYGLSLGYTLESGINVNDHPFRIITNVYIFMTDLVRDKELSKKTIKIYIDKIHVMDVINPGL